MGYVKISREPVEPGSVLREAIAVSRKIGGIVMFVGVVRSISRGKEVAKLSYDVYEEMALKVLEDVRREAMERFGVIDAFIIHRVGEVKVGEVSLVVIAADEHRANAFKAAAWIVDEVKRRVPIWKKEYYTDGTAKWI